MRLLALIFSIILISMVKGDLEVGELFTVQNYHLKIGDVERTIWGDIEFQEGMTYFLFLAHIDNDLYQTTMLSYAAFEEYTADGRKVLVPFGLGTEDNGHGIAAGVDPEPLGVYKSGKLEGLLKDVITGVRSWDAVSVTSDLKVEDFAEYRMLPDHCATCMTLHRHVVDKERLVESLHRMSVIHMVMVEDT